MGDRLSNRREKLLMDLLVDGRLSEEAASDIAYAQVVDLQGRTVALTCVCGRGQSDPMERVEARADGGVVFRCVSCSREVVVEADAAEPPAPGDYPVMVGWNDGDNVVLAPSLASAHRQCPEVFGGVAVEAEAMLAAVDAVNCEGNYHEFVFRPAWPHEVTRG